VVVVASHLSGHLTPAPGARFPRKTGKT